MQCDNSMPTFMIGNELRKKYTVNDWIGHWSSHSVVKISKFLIIYSDSIAWDNNLGEDKQ